MNSGVPMPPDYAPPMVSGPQRSIVRNMQNAMSSVGSSVSGLLGFSSSGASQGGSRRGRKHRGGNWLMAMRAKAEEEKKASAARSSAAKAAAWAPYAAKAAAEKEAAIKKMAAWSATPAPTEVFKKFGGSRRARNMRGRFLSKRKAARMTFKRRASRASTVGTKAQVFHGTAKHTSGGLTRKDLMKTKKGRIVSKRKHAAGKVAVRRLKAAGFTAKKGAFKLFRK